MRRRNLLFLSATPLVLGLLFAGPKLYGQTYTGGGPGTPGAAASPALSAQLPCPLAGTPDSTSALCVSIVIAPGAAGLGSAAYGINPLNVGLGTTVIWLNQDSVPHTVTADDGSFDSGTVSPGQYFSHSFDNAGSYSYHDMIYGPQSMFGTVVVSPTPPVTTSTGVPTYSSNCGMPTYPFPNFPYPFPPGPPRGNPPTQNPNPKPSPRPSPLPSLSPGPAPSPIRSPAPNPTPPPRS